MKRTTWTAHWHGVKARVVEPGIPREHMINNLLANEKDLRARAARSHGDELADLEDQLQAVRRRLRSLGRRVA